MEVLGTKVVVMVILAVVSFALGINSIQDATKVLYPGAGLDLMPAHP